MTAATRAECEAAKKAYDEEGSYGKAALKLGIPKTTIHSRIKILEAGRSVEADHTKEGCLAQLVEVIKKHGPDVSNSTYRREIKNHMIHQRWWKSWAEFKADGIKAAGIEQEPLSVRERQRYADQISILSSDLRKANRELNSREDFRKTLFDLTSEPIQIPTWALPKSRTSSDLELPMLHVSDWQIGEVIAKERTGFNEFNRDVAEERVKLMVAKTIELSFVHRGNKQYPGIYYLRGGDMISGEIHPDLSESNDMQSLPATRFLVRLETYAISELQKAFGKVHVKSVPGNHGRSTEKPRTKRGADDNFDILSHYWLEDVFESNQHVSFDAPQTGDAVFNVWGYNFCLTHGDRIGSSGGQGFIGPAATITRGMKKTLEYYSTLGQVIDYFLVGHFHVALKLEYGFSNGCLPGYSEYAKGFRMRPHPPSQNLLYVHPAYGVADLKEILLADRVKLAKISQPWEVTEVA